MYSKIFCYDDLSDLKKIHEYVLKENESFRIITDNQHVVKYFKAKSIKINHIDDFFPVYSSSTFQIYNATKKTILQYAKFCEEIKFKDQNITMGLIHYMTNDILYIEKIKHILENKDNTVFILEKFHHKCFIINEIAEKYGYVIDEYIILIKNNKLSKIRNTENISYLEKANIRSRYRKSLSLYSSNLSSENSKRISRLIKLSKRLIPMICKLVISKFYELRPENSLRIIFKNIDSKITNNNSEKYLFFLSGGREDVFIPFYRIFKKFNDENIDFLIIAIDPISSSYLQKEGFQVIDLFPEVFTLSNSLKKIDEDEVFKKNLIKVATHSNFNLLYMNNLNLELLDGIYRSISVSMIIEHILKRTKVKNSILIEGSLLGMIVTSVSKKLKVSTTSIETLIIDDNAISSILYKADKICIYGKQGKETLQSFGISDNRILVTGNPKYDYIASIDPEKSKSVLKDKYKIDISKKIVTVALSRWHEFDEKWMVDLIRFCNANNLEIVIKLHPRYKVDLQESEFRINHIKKECRENNFHISFDIDLSLLLSASDLVVSDYSNVAVEAVLLGKTVINTNFIKEDLSKAQNYHRFGAVLYTEDYNELERFIKEIITNNKYKDVLQKGYDIMIEKYNFKNDGNASERIFKYLTSNQL